LGDASRRGFLKAASTVVAAGCLGFPSLLRGATDSRKLKIGLVGCGGRGTGAANNALNADSNLELFALADVFGEKLQKGLAVLQTTHPGKVNVPAARQFVGLDAYQHVIECCDVVLLCTPPGFRPQHLRAAIEAGKHVFTEKPVATDAPGVRSVIASAALAKQKGLGLLAGFNWRHDFARRELEKRIHEGAIGEVRAIYATYYVGLVHPFPAGATRPPEATDLEWQLRNWYNFVWLSGDGYVEQAVHAVDWLMWTMKDVPPLNCVAIGGRQIPNVDGNIFDHFEANYEWPGGVRCFVGARQQQGCYGDNSLYILGTKGSAQARRGRAVAEITGETNWKFDKALQETDIMHQTEQTEFFASLRAGEPICDGEWMAHSTLAAIMGRMAAYTGQQITWEMAMTSKEQLVPDQLDWNMKLPVAPMAIPGQTKFY
jgi:predicted dehydrogenase